MKIQTDDYRVWYDSATATLNFQGFLREKGLTEYQPIQQLLDAAIAQQPPTITINLKELDFLNSAGMTILSRFIIDVRRKKTIQLIVKASNEITWQNKSLGNWLRLMPSLILNFD